MKYLTLIRTIALLHQYQRPLKTVQHNGVAVPYIEVSKQDIQTANKLAHEVLGRSLDELPPQTRRFLIQLTYMVKQGCNQQGVEQEDYRFTRREIREHLGLGNTQARIHLSRLIDMEYIVAHHGARGQQYVYELAYDCKADSEKPFMSGLIDTNKLETHNYDANLAGLDTHLAGQKKELAGGKRCQNGPKTGGLRGVENHKNSNSKEELQETMPESLKNALKEEKKPSRTSYVVMDQPTPFTPIPLAASGKSPGSL